MPLIIGVVPGSIADEGGVRPGDTLVSVGGEEIRDVFDYRFHTAYDRLSLLLRGADGEEWMLDIERDAGWDGGGEADPDAELGLVFADGLLDEPHGCANRCVFCFIDQLPEGMRPTLYFKDDDPRLSFTNGNYVTLTNTPDAELDRLIRYRLSPVNVSVHTTDSRLRARMLGIQNEAAADIMPKLRRLTKSGITVNAQIVLCKGYNDGAALDRTLADLGALNARLLSVSVVPSGLTGHRDGLAPLEPFSAEDARAVIAQLGRWRARFRKGRENRLVYPADEFYVLAGLRAPGRAFYEGWPQLENGVGMIALFRETFRAELRSLRCKLAAVPTPAAEARFADIPPAYIFTGEAAGELITVCIEELKAVISGLKIEVIPVKNIFFGGMITVTGLLTGRDILNRAKSIHFPQNARILLSKTLFRYGTDVFLDDVSLDMLRAELKVDIIAVENDGRALVRAILNQCQVTSGQKTH